MRIQVLKHLPFEGPAAIEHWARTRGHDLAMTNTWQDDLPALANFDLLAIMGGTMNVYEENDHPWLAGEKRLIAEAISAGKAVLGVCLGGQLIAAALGAVVTRNPHVEIGWFPVSVTDEARSLPLLAEVPDAFPVVHWHGDTFAIPEGATHILSSQACANQGFIIDGGRVLGLQCHLEETRESLAALTEHAANELVEGEWIQTPAELLAEDAPFDSANQLLFTLMDRMTA